MTGLFGMAGYHAHDRQRTARAEAEARRAQSKAQRAEHEAQGVEARLDKLTLICMALWSFVSEKLQLTEEDLMERIKKLDLMDGESDGKLQRQVAKCAQCGRVMSSRHSKCLYCGAERLKLTAFDELI